MVTRARDLMQTDVVVVTAETPLLQIHRLFIEEEINGAPVVDEDGEVVGVISSLDLLREVQEEYDTGAGINVPMYFREELPYSGPDWLSAPEDFQDRMSELTAADAMVKEIVSVTPDTSVSEVARIMREQHIHRVLVVADGELEGILTSFDLISQLEQQ
jgi:CBS domain-containing protein